MDTNGSTESFELVTEDNNGEGKAKTDGRNSFRVHHLKSEKEEVCVCVCVRFQCFVLLHFLSSVIRRRVGSSGAVLWHAALQLRAQPQSVPKNRLAQALQQRKVKLKKQEKWFWAASGSV